MLSRDFRPLLIVLIAILVALPSAFAAPVAFWSFDEGEGSLAADSSGNLNHASLHGPAWVEGRVGGGLAFAGAESDQYLIIPSSESLQLDGPFTVQFWWLKTADHVQIFFRKGARHMNFYAYAESALHFSVGCTDGKSYSVSAPMPEDGWRHLGFTYDGARLRIIEDGEVTGEAETGDFPPVTDDTPLYIGTHSPGYKWSLAGTLDELCISEGEIAPDELLAELAAARELDAGVVEVRTFEPTEGALVLARDGVAGASIVVAADATQLQFQPARELHGYLRRITGAWLPIRTDDEDVSGNLILVGESRHTREMGLDPSALAGDSWLMKTAPGRLALLGPDRVLGGDDGNAFDQRKSVCGTANAVHAFLHERGGGRWFMPGRLGEVARESSNLEVPELDVMERSWRDYELGGLWQDQSWARRNLLGAGQLMYHRGGHLWYTLIPTAKYFDDHPEWFALHDGRRAGEGNHLCTTNEEMRAEALKNLRALFDEGYEWIELGQTDGYRRCECEACEAQDQYRSQVGWFIPTVPADRIHLFHNWLAEQIKQSHPDRTLIVIAYGPSAAVPKAIDHYSDNVIIEFTHDPDQLLEAWAGFHDRFVSYVYWFAGHGSRGYGPKTAASRVAEGLRRHIAAGSKAFYLCGGGDCWGTDAPAYYAAASLMRDPDTDVGELLIEFSQGLFGPAAQQMMDYFALLDMATRNYRDGFGSIEYIPGEPFKGEGAQTREIYTAVFPEEALARMGGFLDRAAELAATDDQRRRVAFFRDGFDLTRLTTEAFVALDRWEQAKDDASLGALRDAAGRRDAFVDEMLARQAAAGGDLPPVIGVARKYLIEGPHRCYAPIYAPLGEG